MGEWFGGKCGCARNGGDQNEPMVVGLHLPLLSSPDIRVKGSTLEIANANRHELDHGIGIPAQHLPRTGSLSRQ